MASSTRTPCYPLSNRRTRAKSPPGASGIPSAMYTRPKTKSSHGRWHPSWRMNHDGQYWLNWNSLDLLSAAGKYHIQAWLKRLRLLLNVYCHQNCRDLLTAAKFDSSLIWTHPDHLRSLGCIFFRKWIQSLPCFGCQVAGNQLTKWKGKTVFFIGPSKKFKSTLWEIQSHYLQCYKMLQGTSYTQSNSSGRGAFWQLSNIKSAFGPTSSCNWRSPQVGPVIIKSRFSIGDVAIRISYSKHIFTWPHHGWLPWCQYM